MDTNKMRAEFEAAYESESAKRNGRFDPAVLTRGDDGDYVIPSVQSAWWGWQASREAVAVVLPDEQPGYMYYAPDVLAAIEAQGLKVAP